MNPYNLREKALALLRMSTLPFGSTEWEAELDSARNKFSEKAVGRKLVELHERGYITPFGTLTDKGKRALGGEA